MKLYHAAASPFVRKVQIAAMELGLHDQIELVNTVVAPGKENAAFAADVNPLRKIPALQLDDGTVLMDSSVICEYLDSLDGNNRLFPAQAPRRWQVQTGHAIANGVMDSAVLIRYETFLRPEPQRCPVWVEEQWGKISNGLGWFESRVDDGPMTIDRISLASALGYLDFRSAEFAWREKYPSLAAWHGKVAQSSAYSSTEPSS